MAFDDTIVNTVFGQPTTPEDTDGAANAITEGAAVNTTVGITAHSTFANGNAPLDYSLSGDSSGGGFKIDQNTGVVTVADPSKIDFESSPGHVYSITVIATKNNNFSSEQTFTISVNDLAPSTPVDSNAAANTVVEGAANGTAVGITASSTDVNGGTVTWSLIGDDSNGGFTINATTGVITVADGSKIDYESAPGHAYRVNAQASDGTLVNSQIFTINVGDVALSTPVDSNAAANSVAEGAAAGTGVGITASAIDPSGPATTYSLIGDTSAGGFTINASTGVVSVADPSKIDFESSGPGHSYNITVQASNGVQTTSQAFTVGVTNTAPSTPADSNAAANTVAEGAANGSTVGLTVSSTDVNGPAVTYAMAGDTSLGGFTVNSATGVVTVLDATKINYETAAGHAYQITVQASDGTTPNYQLFTIAVTNVAPSTPVDSNAATNTVAEGSPNGTGVGITAFAFDINGPGVTYSLAGDSSLGGFTIDSSTGVVSVLDSTKIDFETAAGHAYQINVKVSDGALVNYQIFNIAVTNVAPLTPVDHDAATNSVTEGAANGSTVGLTAFSTDPGGTALTYSLAGDTSLGGFTINSTTGVVTVLDGTKLNYETAPGRAYQINVQVSDGTVNNYQIFNIAVADAAPSAPVDTNGTANLVLEGAANGTAVGITASSTDPGGGPAATFSLTDSAGGRFAIDSTTGVVTVANGAAIDFETAPGPGHSYGITVQATAGALSSTQNFSIGVGNVNEAPAGTDKTVTMLEGDSHIFSIADFGFTDPSDSIAPNSLLAVKMTTVPGAGAGTFTNNGIAVNAGDFISASDIAAGHLVFTPALHATGSPEASFTFQVQDNGGTANGGVDLDQSPNTVTINVNAVNDPPVNSVPGTQGVNEDATLTFSAGNGNAITISDLDVGSGNETVTLSVTSGTLALGSTAGLTSFTNNASSITLTGTVANVNAAMDGLTYHGNLNFNGTETLVVSTNDNGNTGAGGPKTDTDNVTINVAAVNDAPVNSVPGTQTVNEDATLVFSGGNAISISDVDAGIGNETVTLSVASGALTLNGTAGLAFTVGDGSADSTMTFSGTVAAINTALNGLSYLGNLNFNGSDTLHITTNDNGNTGSGGALSDTDSFTINVSAVNDAPVVTAGHTLNYTENQAATAIDPALAVSDVDSANLASATVQITGNYVNGEDVLGFTTQNGITGSFNAATGTLTLTGSSSVANYQTALASVTYVNTSDNPSGAARTVTITANDGTDNSIAATDTINVTPVNDAPVVTAGHTLNYTENQAATAIDPAIAVSDVDSANLASATVQITGNYINGEDVLGFTTQNGISGSFNAATGTLTLTGSSSVANYQAALASVTYVNTSDNPSGAARTVTIVTNDGALNSVAATDTINVTPVNDAPVATAGHTLGYTENDPATAIDTAFTVSDVDSANLASATVQITGNYVNGQDVLGFTTQNGITGVFNAATGTMTLTGSSSVANYQTALDSVTYVNTSDDPSAASRTVTIITNDGAANSVAVTDTITVQPVNDAPTLTATGNNPNYSAGVDLFSGVSASTIEAGQLLDQLTLTVTNISGTTTDSLTIDGTTVALTNGNVVSTTTPGVTATVAVSGSTATVTIASTPGLSGTDMATLVDGLSYTDTNISPGDPARVVTLTSLHDTGGTSPGVDTTALNITSTVSFDIAPTVTAGHTLNYTENQAATAFDPAITVSDPDNVNLVSATVQITGNYVNGEDVLGFTTQNGITGSFDAPSGTLTLTGSSSVANYQTALASVTYVNTSDNPSGAARTVTITANDGFVNSTPVTDTINVTPVNDAPVVTAGHTLNYTENQAATAIDPAITVSDLDNANLASATVQITGNYVNGQDVLGFTTQNGISGSFDAPSGTLTLTGSSSVANYQAALASVTYVNTSENPSGLARTVTIIANDGTANSVAKTDTINVTPVNDAPVTTAGGTLNYTENQVATAIDATVTVSDVDNTNLSSATVQLTTNYVNGQDILGFTTQNGITGVFSAATGTMTLSGSSSVANYQTALRSVTYFDNSDNPSGLDRTVVYTANDGAVNSNSSTSTIHVTPVNDAPVVTATGTLAYTENQVATAIAPALTVTDADTATLTTATVQITANYVNGEDVLAFTTQNGITGSFDAPSGTMTLTGTASVANYQTALESVTYVNTSENPSTSARTVTFTADDGQGANHLSAGSNHTITVASVDDAPVNNGVPGSFTVMSGFSHAITGLSISDVDAGAGNDITTTLTSVGTAFVTVGAVGGGAAITGNGTNAVTLTGTIGQINASLGGSVAYTAADNVTTSQLTTLTIATNDHGHTGTGGPITDTDVVSVGVTPQVWFINQDQSSLDSNASRGSQTNPFSDVNEFNAASLTATGPGANDYIYVKQGTYNGQGINLKAGQTLLGDDQPLSLTDPFGGPAIVIETSSGARPTINVTAANSTDQGIALASGNTVQGIIVTTNASGQTAIDDSGASVGSLTIGDTDVSGGGQAVNITHGGALTVGLGTVSSSGGATGIALGGALTGSFTGTTGALSGHSGNEVNISGGASTISYGGTIGDGSGNSASITGISGGSVTLSGNINDGVDANGGIGISNNTGGTITFSGATKTLNTGIGDAVSMTNNSGATVNFTTGGLDITTTNGTGFQASVAGTYNVTGSGNTIATSGTGRIVSLDSVTVGSSGVTFGSLQSTGTVSNHAISFNNVDGGNTFTSGGVSIAGTSGAGNDGINISGGSATTFQFGGTTTISNTADDGIAISGANGAVSFNSVALNGMGGDAVDVSGNTAAVTLSAGSIGNTNDPAGVGVKVGSGTGDVSVGASITKTTAGHAVDVSGHTGGTLAFSGAISGTGAVDDGISLSSNTGATMNFSGGMTLTTGANAAFSATGGGTVNVTNGANNHLTTTTGTALNISNTNIGASDVTFQDISSSGGSANGIILDTTGAAGGLHVTGVSAAASGGTIASKTGADGSSTQGTGIYLNSTTDVQLNHMQLNNFQNFGIRGFEVNGFSLANSTVNATSGVNGTNAGFDEGSISFRAADSAHNGLTGTASITNSVIANGLEDNMNVFNNSGSLNLTVSGSTFRDTSAGTPGNDGLLLEADNTANITGLITTSSFLRNFADGVQVINNGSGNVDVDVGQAGVAGSGGTFTDNFVGVNMDQNGAGTFNFNVLNAGFTTPNYAALFGAGTAGSPINVNRGGAASPVARGLFTGNIDNNTIDNSDSGTGPGIEVSINGTGTGSNTATVKIDNNNISHVGNWGIHVITLDGNAIVNATITNNTVQTTTNAGLEAIRVDGGATSSQAGAPGTPDNGTINFDIHGNTVDSSATGGTNDIRVRQRFNVTDKIEGYAGSATNDAQVAAYIAGLNSHLGVGTLTVSADHNNTGFGTIAAVPEPPAPMLALPGGVQASSPTPGVTSLSQAQLDTVVAAAIAQWAHAGASGAQLAMLSALTFSVSDLAGDRIADQSSGHITVDVNAAGHGWFIDPTPFDNAEFTHAQNAAGTDLLTDPSNAAAGHLDLLTAVSHEMGHQLGLDDSTAAADAHDLMYIGLVDGERRMPDATDVALANASSAVQAEAALPVSAQAAANTPIVIGTAGNDTIDAGHGGNILFGGGGADNFVFGPSTPLNAPTPAQVTHVADYSAAQGDTFDFSAITSAFHNSGLSDSLVVRAVEDASGKFAMLQVDHIDPMGLPSAPNWVNVAQLDGAHAGDAVNVLIDNHSTLHLAQLHVDLLV